MSVACASSRAYRADSRRVSSVVAGSASSSRRALSGFAVSNESALFNKASARPSVRWQAAGSRKRATMGSNASRCIAFLIDFLLMMGQRYGILVSMVVFYGRKVAACSLQNFCIHFAVLLQIYVQCYCKPFAAPLQKACSVFAVGSVCVSIVNGVIQQSVILRGVGIFPLLQPLYPRPSVDCALPA